MGVLCYKGPNDSGLAYPTPNICNETAVEGGFYPCCNAGDICLPNNICHFTHSQGGTSGYYVASCNDPSYTDPSCSQECLDQADTPNIVYNSTSSLWACCGTDSSGAGTCAVETTETFEAPAPEVLLQSTVALLTSTPTPIPTPTSSAAAATSTSATASSSHSSSAGKDAAIGLGAVLGVLILALLVAGAYVMRRRRTNRRTAPPPETPGATGPDAYNMDKMQYPQQQHHQHHQSGYGTPPVPYDQHAPQYRPAAQPHPYEMTSDDHIRRPELAS